MIPIYLSVIKVPFLTSNDMIFFFTCNESRTGGLYENKVTVKILYTANETNLRHHLTIPIKLLGVIQVTVIMKII